MARTFNSLPSDLTPFYSSVFIYMHGKHIYTCKLWHLILKTKTCHNANFVNDKNGNIFGINITVFKRYHANGYSAFNKPVTRGVWLNTWWRHQMETFSALLAICVGNLPVTSEFPSQRPVTRSFDVFFDLSLNKHLSKQSRGRWFAHYDVTAMINSVIT